MTTQEALKAPRTTLRVRYVVWATLAVLVAFALWVGGVVAPFLVNGLHRLPLSEVTSGAYDPKDMWPYDTAGGLVRNAGLLGMLLVPLAAFCGLLLSAWAFVDGLRRRATPLVAAAVGLALVSALGAAAFASPWGTAMATWMLD